VVKLIASLPFRHGANGRIDAVKAVTHHTSVERHLVEAPLDEDCPSFFRTGPG
jgi:hypothetical protein